MAVSDRIQEKFEQFHRDNPHILTILEHLASEEFRSKDRVGIALLWEQMRAQLNIETNGERFKLPNNHRSRYARLLIQRHPAWAGRIRVAQLRSES